MTAFPSQEPPTDFSQQKPLTLNEGFQQPPAPQEEFDPLYDDESISKAAMDARGSKQIAPYASFDVVQQALDNGYYTGLEAMDFGTLPDGTPAALFTDQNGMRQAIRLSPDKWFAAMQQRAEARVSMAKKMRNQRDAQRLRPAIADMTKELEAIAPGFREFAEIGMEENAPQTYALVQDVYRRMQEKDENEQRKLQAELRKVIDDRQMQMTQGLADNFVTTEIDGLDLQIEGVASNNALPEEVRMTRVLDLQRKKKNIERFGFLIPPAPNVARMASFPSFWFSQANPGALDDLADMSIQTVGFDNINSIAPQNRIPMLMQQAQTLARNIGWSMPFSPADIQIMSQVINDRMTHSSRPVMLAPSGFSEQVAGASARFQRGEQAREAEMAMQEAKLETERARPYGTMASAESRLAAAERTRMMAPAESARVQAVAERIAMLAPAERDRLLAQVEEAGSKAERTRAMTPIEAERGAAAAEKTAAEAEQIRGESAILRGEKPVASPRPTARRAAAEDIELSARAAELGISVPEGVPVLDYLADTAERLAANPTAENRAALQQIYRLVAELQTR